MVERRWRGFKDVPATEAGLEAALDLGEQLHCDLICHDYLSRCKDTAEAMHPKALSQSMGPRPWRMGPGFEGWPITPEGLRHAQYLVEHPKKVPTDGESFLSWYTHWTDWVDALDPQGRTWGVVTHNRNIQALYSRVNGWFDPKVYNCVGPEPLSVHKFSEGVLTPWDGTVTSGIYLIRHAETEWGT